MKKIAVVFLALSFLLTSCSSWIFQWSEVQVVNKTNANYLDYSQEALASTSGNKVIFFHAGWCGSCKKADKKIAESVTTDNLTVFKADFDTATDLRKKYEVTKQHTFVQVDSQGEMLNKWSGSKNIEDIQSELVEYNEPMVDTMIKDETTEMMDASKESKMVDDMLKDSETSQASQDTNNPQEEEKVVGMYWEYSQESFENAAGQRVLFFHAKWCPSCVNAAKNFSESTTPEGLNVFKVDYDSSADLKSQYGVVTQHTFVAVDENGTMVKRWFGSRSYEDILNELQS